MLLQYGFQKEALYQRFNYEMFGEKIIVKHNQQSLQLTKKLNKMDIDISNVLPHRKVTKKNVFQSYSNLYKDQFETIYSLHEHIHCKLNTHIIIYFKVRMIGKLIPGQ